MAATTACTKSEQQPAATTATGLLEGSLVEALGPLNVGRRIFRNTTDDHARRFHGACDCRGPTLLIAKSSNGFVFGAYTAQDWDGTVQGWVPDTTGTNFLFSWKRPGTEYPEGLVKFPIFDRTHGTYSRFDHGPLFGSSGSGHDLWFPMDCFTHSTAYCKLFCSYRLPNPVPKAFEPIRETVDVDWWMGGSHPFTLTEYEVYLVSP
ncbi:hypothetical protein Pelo_17916 [Pelomyxa schiedti]|nr:hypothetical protein Pelo_17916 [Pelomyxa schiedti]